MLNIQNSESPYARRAARLPRSSAEAAPAERNLVSFVTVSGDTDALRHDYTKTDQKPPRCLPDANPSPVAAQNG